MPNINGKTVLYGISNIEEKIDNILTLLNLQDHNFETKLIMFEAITNAFIHGNNKDSDKPIYVAWKLTDKLLRICITDCGQGLEKLNICKEINEKNILDECGRGLFIIRSYSDQVKFEGSSIIIEKKLC